MRNKIFQWLWYNIFRHIVKAGTTGGPERRHKQFVFMLKMAKLFGGARSVLVGDSEITTFDNYKAMSEFNTIVLNFGVPGTVADEWADYFMGIGWVVYNLIKNIRQGVSTGGNYSLRSLMNNAEPGMIRLHALLPLSWILLIPPVYLGALAIIKKTREQWKDEMATLRGLQLSIWNPRKIDTYTPFLNPETGEALPMVLADMVHFSKKCAVLTAEVMDYVV